MWTLWIITLKGIIQFSQEDIPLHILMSLWHNASLLDMTDHTVLCLYPSPQCPIYHSCSYILFLDDTITDLFNGHWWVCNAEYSIDIIYNKISTLLLFQHHTEYFIIILRILRNANMPKMVCPTVFVRFYYIMMLTIFIF